MEKFPVNSAMSHTETGSLDAALDHAAVNLHGAVDKASASASEAAGSVEPAIARVAQIAHHAVDRAVDVAAPSAAWMTARRESLATAKRNAVSDARVYVSENPWQSIGVALAAGFLLARLAR